MADRALLTPLSENGICCIDAERTQSCKALSMGLVEDRLTGIGEVLPMAKPPVANYLGCKQSGNLLFVSGRVSSSGDLNR